VLPIVRRENDALDMEKNFSVRSSGATVSQRYRAAHMRKFTRKTDAELVALYGEVMSELFERGVVRSGNNPISDMAERLIADYYGVERQPANNKSFDVLTKDGTKIQVKALRRTRASRRNLSALRTLDFDYVAAVIFENDMRLSEAVFVPLDAVRDHMGWSNTWNAHRLSVTKKLLNDPRVRRIPADELVGRAAASS
jgi:hypothetical protein